MVVCICFIPHTRIYQECVVSLLKKPELFLKNSYLDITLESVIPGVTHHTSYITILLCFPSFTVLFLEMCDFSVTLPLVYLILSTYICPRRLPEREFLFNLLPIIPSIHTKKRLDAPQRHDYRKCRGRGCVFLLPVVIIEI